MRNSGKQFLPEHFLTELKKRSRRRAREGWDYLISHGVAQSEILEALRSTVSRNLSRFPSLPLLKPRQARALGKRLIADAERLKESLPELRLWYSLPLRLHRSSLPQGTEFESLAELIRTAGEQITGLRSVPNRSARDKGNEANAALSVLNLFLRTTIPPDSAVDPDLAIPPKMYTWTVELVTLALERAGLTPILTADALRMQHRRISFGSYLNKAQRTTK